MEFTALFCDQARALDNGKLDIQGVFSELYAPGFPAQQDHMVLAGIVEWNRDDEGRIPFRLDIMHPDDFSIFTVDGHADVQARAEPRPPAKSHLVFPLQRTVFTSPGKYRVRAELNGVIFDGPCLYLVKSASQQQDQQQDKVEPLVSRFASNTLAGNTG